MLKTSQANTQCLLLCTVSRVLPLADRSEMLLLCCTPVFMIVHDSLTVQQMIGMAPPPGMPIVPAAAPAWGEPSWRTPRAAKLPTPQIFVPHTPATRFACAMRLAVVFAVGMLFASANAALCTEPNNKCLNKKSVRTAWAWVAAGWDARHRVVPALPPLPSCLPCSRPCWPSLCNSPCSQPLLLWQTSLQVPRGHAVRDPCRWQHPQPLRQSGRRPYLSIWRLCVLQRHVLLPWRCHLPVCAR